MTEAEIMKALEWCEMFTDNIVLSSKKGEKFTFALQSLQTIKQVLKDYNRKNAEIETARAEAIKEFAESVKEAGAKSVEVAFYGNGTETIEFITLRTNLVDKIAKEMGVEL